MRWICPLVTLWLCYGYSFFSLLGNPVFAFSEAPKSAVPVNPNAYPARGWNPADCFSGAPNETQTLKFADIMVQQGWRDNGYTIVTLDGAWWQSSITGQMSVDGYGRFIPSVDDYPCAKDGKGLSCLVNQLQAIGMELGVWIIRGVPKDAVTRKLPVYGTNCTADQIVDPQHPCEWLPDLTYGVSGASACGQAYYHSVAQLYHDWGLRLVKADCFYGEPEHRDEISALAQGVTIANGLGVRQPDEHSEPEIFPISMDRALKDKAQTDLLLSWSPGNNATVDEAKWANANGVSGHMYRITGDVWDYWWHVERGFDSAVNHSILIPYQDVNHSFVDLDILPFGWGFESSDAPEPAHYSWLSKNEQRVMFSLWCFVKSPLFIGGMLPLDALTIEIMQNKGLLDVQRFSTSNQLVYASANTRQQIWKATPTAQSLFPLVDARATAQVYAGVFNIANDTSAHINLSFANLGFQINSTSSFILLDLWDNRQWQTSAAFFDVYLDQHNVMALAIMQLS